MLLKIYAGATTFLVLFLVALILVGVFYFNSTLQHQEDLAVQETNRVCEVRLGTLNEDALRRMELAFYQGLYSECYVQTSIYSKNNPIEFCQWRGYRLYEKDAYNEDPAVGWEWVRMMIEDRNVANVK